MLAGLWDFIAEGACDPARTLSDAAHRALAGYPAVEIRRAWAGRGDGPAAVDAAGRAETDPPTRARLAAHPGVDRDTARTLAAAAGPALAAYASRPDVAVDDARAAVERLGRSGRGRRALSQVVLARPDGFARPGVAATIIATVGPTALAALTPCLADPADQHLALDAVERLAHRSAVFADRSAVFAVDAAAGLAAADETVAGRIAGLGRRHGLCPADRAVLAWAARPAPADLARDGQLYPLAVLARRRRDLPAQLAVARSTHPPDGAALHGLLASPHLHPDALAAALAAADDATLVDLCGALDGSDATQLAGLAAGQPFDLPARPDGLPDRDQLAADQF